MPTIATIFSGGEGVGVGAKMAGLNHLWGIEYDDEIAQVARDNGFDTITADVLDVDPRSLEVPDVLHASPVCTRASVANADGEEAQLDIDAAKKTVEFIEVMKPKGFTLENVYPYREFESFKVICDALRWNGYSLDYWHLNSANYGVPQTRKRLILIARLDGGHNRIPKPLPTHHNPANFDDSQMSLFAPTTKPWIGWYEAIEDLIPTLPESKFADWQLERMPEYVTDSLMSVVNGENSDYLSAPEPAQTIASNHGNGKYRAFICDGKLNDNSTSLTTRNGESPTFTVTTSHNNRDVKALIVPGDNGALLFGNNANDTSGAKIYNEQSQPAQAVRVPSGGRVQRAWLSQGRVVKMTPRALARFQSFTDSYQLPDDNTLAVKVIGNAVPPLMYKNVIRAMPIDNKV